MQRLGSDEKAAATSSGAARTDPAQSYSQPSPSLPVDRSTLLIVIRKVPLSMHRWMAWIFLASNGMFIVSLEAPVAFAVGVAERAVFFFAMHSPQ